MLRNVSILKDHLSYANENESVDNNDRPRVPEIEIQRNEYEDAILISNMVNFSIL